MKMTITLDGAPDDFVPMLEELGLKSQPISSIPCDLPEDPIEWFRSKLKAAGIHSEDVAIQVGLAPSGLSARVRGRTPWSLEEAAKACETLGTDLKEFAHFYGRREPL